LFLGKRIRKDKNLQTNESDIEFRPRYVGDKNSSPTKNTPSKRRGIGMAGMQTLFDSKLTVKQGEYYEQWNFTDLCDPDALDDQVAFDIEPQRFPLARLYEVVGKSFTLGYHPSPPIGPLSSRSPHPSALTPSHRAVPSSSRSLHPSLPIGPLSSRGPYPSPLTPNIPLA